MSSTPQDQYLAVCAELAVQRKRAERAEARLRLIEGGARPPTDDELVRELGAQIVDLRALLAAARATMKIALDALLYHTEQTRPIYETDASIRAIRDALAAPEKP